MRAEILKTELDWYFTYASYIKVMYPEAHSKASEWAGIDKMVKDEK